MASVYTPSLMIVLITFTTFWLGPSSIADRITIGITAFLAIVTQFSQSRAELPPVSYISVSRLIRRHTHDSCFSFAGHGRLELGVHGVRVLADPAGDSGPLPARERSGGGPGERDEERGEERARRRGHQNPGKMF